MASRRTISYIGLWALIVPWLGFTWETKTILFSLTGLVLLFIGNKHYNNEKKKQKDQNLNTPVQTKHEENFAPTVKEEEPKKFVPDYRTVPEYMNPVSASNTNNQNENSPAVNLNIVEESYIKPKPRVRKKVEMVSRPRRVSIKQSPDDSFEINHEQS